MTQDFQGKTITVFGLGLNQGGIGTVRFLAGQGAGEIIVTDLKTEEDLAPSIEALQDIPNVRYVLGRHEQELFTRTDMVIKTPGVPWTNEYVRMAEAAGIPVETDSSIFFRHCPCPIVGVTGTKGKTTTSMLIAMMLRASGYRVVEAGIGQISVLGQLRETTPDSVVVFELSSWRLSGLRVARMSPNVAVFTNFFPDHMNYYSSMEEYFADKRVIFEFQRPDDWYVYNAGSEYLNASVAEAPGRRLLFSSQIVTKDLDLFVHNGNIIRRVGNQEETLLAFSETKLRGAHNEENILAALGGAIAFGADLSICARALREFSGIPHRLEFIARIGGVHYYNDSAATVPEATLAALDAFHEPIVLIAGGTDKNLDFGILSSAIIRRAKGVVLLRGTATEKLLDAIRAVWPEEFPFPEIPVVESMMAAVEAAQKMASEGDVVLLSPGAASFGLFQNEFDRGDQFRYRVKESALL